MGNQFSVMVDGVTIRRGIPADLLKIVKLKKDLFGEDETYLLATVLADMETLGYPLFVAVQDRFLAGYIVYWAHRTSIRVQDVTVAPEVRRQGIGRGLLRKVVAQLNGRRHRVEIRAEDTNLDAHLWLKACGAKATSVVGSNYCFHLSKEDFR